MRAQRHAQRHVVCAPLAVRTDRERHLKLAHGAPDRRPLRVAPASATHPITAPTSVHTRSVRTSAAGLRRSGIGTPLSLPCRSTSFASRPSRTGRTRSPTSQCGEWGTTTHVGNIVEHQCRVHERSRPADAALRVGTRARSRAANRAPAPRQITTSTSPSPNHHQHEPTYFQHAAKNRHFHHHRF